MSTSFTIHKARHGDCILIRTVDGDGAAYNILIDGGPSPTYEESLRNALSALTVIHLLVLTHIDSDHIGGLIRLLRSQQFKELTIHRYWFNAKNLLTISTGTDISLGEARNMEQLLIGLGETPDKYSDIVFSENEVYELAKGIRATIFSPNKYILDLLFSIWPELEKEPSVNTEDVDISAAAGVRLPELTLQQLAELPFSPTKTVEKDIFNSSSIAFLLELPDCRLLLLGDARPEVLVPALQARGYNTTDNKLKADYVKISHHGSRNNTSSELLDFIDCSNYIISTNGGAVQHKHPDRDVIARIVYHPARDLSTPVTIFFNYSVESIASRKGPFILPADKEEGNWKIADDTTKFFI